MCDNNINAYRYLSVIYDKMVNDISFEKWGNYLTSFFNKLNPEVLEYACGTGNVTKELIKVANSVIAVDISEEMLIEAEKKFRNHGLNIKFIESDMLEFRLNNQVDYAVCACDGVNYIINNEDLNRFFANVYSNLRTDGIFLFDISSEYKLKNILGNEFYYEDTEDATLFWQNTYDCDKSIIEMDLILFLKTDDIYSRYDELHIQRAWNLDEIKSCLIKNGFKDIGIYSFDTLDKPNIKDERIQFIAKK